MAVTPTDSAVLVVNPQFGSLVATYVTSPLYSVTLGVVMAAGAAVAASLDVPSPLRVRDYMMAIGSIAHCLALKVGVEVRKVRCAEHKACTLKFGSQDAIVCLYRTNGLKDTERDTCQTH